MYDVQHDGKGLRLVVGQGHDPIPLSGLRLNERAEEHPVSYFGGSAHRSGANDKIFRFAAAGGAKAKVAMCVDLDGWEYARGDCDVRHGIVRHGLGVIGPRVMIDRSCQFAIV